MSSKLVRLRDILQEVQSCQPPNGYHPLDKEHDSKCVENDNDAAEAEGVNMCNQQLLLRYKAARDAYVRQQTLDAFLRSLSEYNPDTGELPLPDDTAVDREDLARRQEEVLEQVGATMTRIEGSADAIRRKWEHFCAKREDLSQIVEGMERSERSRRLEGDGTEEAASCDEDMDMGDSVEEVGIDEEEVALQQVKLDDLRRRRAELENRLRDVRAQILDVEDDCHRTKRAVNELRAQGGRKPLDWRGLGASGNENKTSEDSKDECGGNEYAEYVSAVGEGVVEAEITKMEARAAELKESCQFYDGMREMMEELGGVKILSSKNISEACKVAENDSEKNGGGESGEESLKKRPKIGGGFVLTLMLLQKHILEITLTPSSSDKEGLHVFNARIATQTTLPFKGNQNGDEESNSEQTTSQIETMHSVSLSNLSFSKIMSQTPCDEIKVPPLDDLVSWSRTLESSSHGIRFIVVEALFRLRVAEARAQELATLHEQFAAQVYDVETPPIEGGRVCAEQETVCAINEGIAVALRLGVDCPLVPGSVYVSEIYGVGGWEESQLEELKAAVEEKRCKGPVEAMECLVTQIDKRSNQEDGWVIPATPSLPVCQG